VRVPLEIRRAMTASRRARSASLLGVPWKGAPDPRERYPAGKLSLQPEALGADQEATNGLKHSEKRP
jgi:hypothetical protein